jgi:hypothetical protein
MRRHHLRVILIAALAFGTGLALAWTSSDGAGHPGIAGSEARALTAEYDGANIAFVSPPKGGSRNLDSRLNHLAGAFAVYGQPGAEIVAGRMALPLQDGAVRVIVEAKPERAGEVSASAAALGIPVEASYGDLRQLLVPVSRLEVFAEEESVALVRLPWKAVPAGTITGEGASLINADEWHAAGFTGDGAKVAILDPGFAGHTSLLGIELPGSVVAHSCRADGDITGQGERHGTAVAEIVHEVAPGAELYLANFDTEVEFANCVDWLTSQGVDIVNHSVGWYGTGPGDGTGFINDAVNLAKTQGVLWVNAAGNDAQAHWMGPWDDPDTNDLLNFAVDDESNAIAALAGDVVTVVLKWDDPFGASCNDYDLLLVDSFDFVVAFSDGFQDCGPESDPVEGFSYTVPEDGVYHVLVTRYSADGLANFHLYSLGPHVCPESLQYCVESSSIAEPGDNVDVLAVGAVPWNDPDAIEPFSSQGPTHDDRVKPDIVGPDRVGGASYGLYPEGFAGTSASAPHAAGAAALVWDWQPDWSRGELWSFLESGAIDLGDPGFDNTYGAGRLDLGKPEWPPTATPTDTPTPTATPTPTLTPTPTMPVGDVNWDGTVNALDAVLVLQFSAGLIDSLPP